MRKILHGVGSVINLWPQSRMDRRLSRTPEQRIRDAWERVGGYLNSAMHDYDSEKKKTAR